MAQSAAPQDAAQQAAPKDAAKPKQDAIQEVVVTARYVKENIQNTPIAITAQSQVELKAANVVNLGTLGAVVPNLWTQPGDTQSAGTPRVRIRGVAQGDTSTLAVPPAVAIYTDDIYHATAAGSELDFTDLASIEVERGPQSTLNGNASIGGAIKLYTKDPQGDGSGFISFGAGSRNKAETSGALDLALTDTLALRVSGHFTRQDGYVARLDFPCEMKLLGKPASVYGTLPSAVPSSGNQNCVIGHLGGINHTTGQAKLRWRPNDKTDLILTASQGIERDEETPEVALSYTGSTAANVMAFITPIRNQYGAGITLNNDYVAPPGYHGYASYSTDCRPFIPNLQTAPTPPALPVTIPSGFCFSPNKSADHSLLSAKLRYEITDKIGLTMIGGYTQYDNAFTQNGDQSPLGLVLAHFENRDYTYTGETRLDGKLFDDKLNWVAGAYILRLEGHQNNWLSFLQTYQPNARVTGTNDSESGFFHLDYSLTDRWRVSGGARYSFEDIAITINNPAAVSILTPRHAKQYRWDWLVSTDYRITDNIMAYANAATGSRPPGLTTIISTPRQLQSTPAEELTSYEGGFKTEWFDHRLRMNIDGFYMDYNKLAATARYFECPAQPGPVATPYVNSTDCAANYGAAGSSFIQWFISVPVPATIAGAEWDVTALPIHGLKVDFAGGYNAFESGIKTPGAIGYYAPGNHRQPTWNMHADASYDFEMSWGTITPRVDWTWQSQQDFNPSPNLSAPTAAFIVKPYSLFNGQIQYKAPDGTWTATLQGTNLADKFYYYQTFPQTLNNQTRLAPPREFMFTVRKDF